MNNIQYKKVEGTLYKYFSNIKQKDRLEKKLINLENERISILNDIKSTNITLKDQLCAVEIKEKIISSGEKISEQERALMNAIRNLENDFKLVMSKILKIKSRIRFIDRMINDIEYVANDFTEEEKRILELKYSGKKTNVYIARVLNIDESTVRRKKREIIEKLSEEMVA